MPKPRPRPKPYSASIHSCVLSFQSRLHLPDTSAVFAALGAVAANYLQGKPVWLMLVGAPSTGKTVIVKACSHLPHCRDAGDSHNSSAFLTFDPKRGQGGLLSPSRIEEGDETGGIGSFGILTYPEFSSVLNLPPDARTFISGVHRRIYDGKWNREFGSNGGRTLEWIGKCGALGAVTQAIDRHTMNAELGERWLYFRFDDPDHTAQANAASLLHAEDPQDTDSALAAAVLEVFDSSGILRGDPPRQLRSEEQARMSRIVRCACLLRGTVARDPRFRDMIDLPQTEGSGRMFAALASIYLALERLGLNLPWAWKIVRKIALDSSPGLRLKVVEHCISLGAFDVPITSSSLQHLIPLSPTALARVLEDLKALKILVEGEPGRRDWVVEKEIVKVMGEMVEDRTL